MTSSSQVFAIKIFEKQVFIYTEYIEGSRLFDCDAAMRHAVAPQIVACIAEMRRLRTPSDGQIGDFPIPAHDNLQRAILAGKPYSTFKRLPKLTSVPDCQRWLVAEVTPRTVIYSDVKTRARVVPPINSLDPCVPIVFTHADLHACNTLIREGRVVGIIDWEMAG